MPVAARGPAPVLPTRFNQPAHPAQPAPSRRGNPQDERIGACVSCADKAWFYVVLLTIGHLGSRGLPKSGSRDDYDA